MPATIWLDFDGDFEQQFGTHSNISTPPWFGDRATIQRLVADDFSPFDAQVVTQPEPGALHVVIGGDGSWLGEPSGGVAFVGSMFSLPVFVFPVELGDDPRIVADAVSHEAGHAFGLLHQTEWAGSRFVDMYYGGPGDNTAPLMGFSYGQRSLWWYGSTLSATTFQNDYEVLGRALGFAQDQQGVIERMGDRDSYSFTTTGGTYTFHITPISDLNPRIQLWKGTVFVGGGRNFTRVLGPGSYTLVIGSKGRSPLSSPTSYGFNVGQYSVKIVGTTWQPVPDLVVQGVASQFTPLREERIAVLGDRLNVTEVSNGFLLELNPYAMGKEENGVIVFPRRMTFVARDEGEMYGIVEDIFPMTVGLGPEKTADQLRVGE